MFCSWYPSFASEIYDALDRLFRPRNVANFERKKKCLQLLIKLYCTRIVDQERIFAVILEGFENDIKCKDGSVVLSTLELTTTFIQDAPLSKSDKQFGNSLPIELDRKQELLAAVYNIIISARKILQRTKLASHLGHASDHSEDYRMKLESAFAKATLALTLIEETGEGKTPDTSARTSEEGNEKKEERKTSLTCALTLKEGSEETEEGNEGYRHADVQKLRAMKGKSKMDDRCGNVAWTSAEFQQLPPLTSVLTLKEGNEEKEEGNEGHRDADVQKVKVMKRLSKIDDRVASRLAEDKQLPPLTAALTLKEGNKEIEEGKTSDTSAGTLNEGNEETEEGNEGYRDADVQKLRAMKGKSKMEDRRGNIAWRLAEYEQLIKGMEKNLVDHPKEYFKYTSEEGKSIFHSVRTSANLKDTWHWLVTKAQIPAENRAFRTQKIPHDLMNKVIELESNRTKKSGAEQNSLPNKSDSRSTIDDVTDPVTKDCDLLVDCSSPSPAVNFATDAAVITDECSDELEAGKRKF